MSCEDVLSHYDNFRDQCLEPTVESKIIAHLETCATCHMEYDIKDSALGALQNITLSFPSQSDNLAKNISSITRTKKGLPYKTIATVLAAACLLLMFLHREKVTPFFNNNDTHSISIMEKELKQLKKSNSLLSQQVVNLNEIKNNQTDMKNNQDDFKKVLKKIDLGNSDIKKIVSSINNNIQEVKVFLQQGGGQATIYTGKGWEEDKKNVLVSSRPEETPVGVKQRVQDFTRILEGY